MEKLKPNYAKKLAKLRYKDEILQLHKEQKPLRDIAKIINYKLARTNLKTSLSKSTIANIIKEFTRKKNEH